MELIKGVLAFCGWAFACLCIIAIMGAHKYSSRIAVAFLPAGLLANSISLIPSSHGWNVCLWLGIMLVASLLLTQLPRSKCAGVYMVTFLPWYAVCRIAVDKLIPLLFRDFQKTVWTTVIIWVLSLALAFLYMTVLREELVLKELKVKGLRILDRVAASLIVAMALLSPMLLYSDKLLLFGLAMLGVGVGVYFLDLWLFHWYLTTDFNPPPTAEEQERAARREARRERRRNSLPSKLLRGTVRGTVGVARLGVGLACGVLRIAGLNVDNPIPDPGPIFDAQAERDRQTWEMIHEAQHRELEDYERVQKETEDAIRFYDENYR